MNPITAITTSLVKSFTYSGRASPAEFWWFQALRVVVLFGFLFALSILMYDYGMRGGIAADNRDLRLLIESLTSHSTLLLVTTCLMLILLPASYASSVRRLHDRGHPGWPMWMVFIASLSQIYIFMLLLLYMLFDPAGVTEGVRNLDSYIDIFIASGGDLDALFGSPLVSVIVAILAICIFVGPLYFIFFSIQACLPSATGANKYGPAPNTPSHNEVFQ